MFRHNHKIAIIILVILSISLGWITAQLPTATIQAAVMSMTPPMNCNTYPEPRILLDSQAWWTKDVGDGFGHVHTLVCWPVRQKVRGIVVLDVQLTMHDDPGGKLTALTIQIGGSGQYVAAQKKFKSALTCANTCSWIVHLDANTTGFANDGWQEFRIRPKVTESDGKTKVGSTSFQVYLDNGKPVKSYRPADFFQGKGWYTGVEYAQARITSPLPSGSIGGNWQVSFACDSSNLPVTGCLFTVDPDFHNGDDGTVLFKRSGSFKGSMSVDTTKLTNGWHKFVIASDVHSSAAGGTERGLLGVYVMINN